MRTAGRPEERSSDLKVEREDQQNWIGAIDSRSVGGHVMPSDAHWLITRGVELFQGFKPAAKQKSVVAGTVKTELAGGIAQQGQN
jgi:hypothetical protein